MVNPNEIQQNSRLGNLLIKKGWLTSQELEHALAFQRNTGKRLGDTLIELGFINQSQLKKVLTQQKWSRSTIAGVMLAASQLFITACGGGGSDDGKAGTEITVPQTNAAPSLNITSPTGGSEFDEGTEIQFTAEASDDEDGNISQNIEWHSDIDGSIGSGAELSSSLTVGEHLISATVTDLNGASANKTLTIVVNSVTENVAPEITITSPQSNSGFYVGEQISFSANASDGEDGNLSDSVVWQSNIDGELGEGDISTTLSLGNHVITASVTDSDGATSNQTVNISISEVTNVAPSLTISSPGNDSNFTESQAITFQASADDQEDGNLSNTIQWSSSISGQIGTGATLSTSLAIGSHTITALVTDSDGAQTTQSINISVVSDPDVAPTVSILTPSNSSSFDEGNSISFSASANDEEDGDIGANIVWTSNRDGNLGTGANITHTLSVGGHVISATITDSSGNQTSHAINLTINELTNVVPQLTITSPSSGSSFNDDDSITFSATANDDEDGDISANITWQSNVDGNLGTGASISSQLTEGNHVITASITDSEGDITNKTISLTINEPANTAPELSITSPSADSSFEEDTSVSFSASASDEEDGDISDNVVWQSSLDGNLGTGANITSTLSAGNHSITATITDSEGDQSTESINLTINAAVNELPTISITSPSAGSSFEEDTSVSFSASASDEEDGDISANITWQSSLDGNLGTGANITSTLSAGNHSITATITDSEGDQSTESINLTINAAVNELPTIDITSPSSGSSFNDDESITFSATANDDEDGDISANITWNSSIDGDIGTGNNIAVTLTDGDHVITASIEDSEGESVSEMINLTITEATDEVPTIDITSPASNSNFVSGSTVSFTATANDDEDGDISANVVWYSDIDGQIGTGSSIDTTLSDGSHQITAEITDSGGNEVQSQVSVTIAVASGDTTLSWTAPVENTDDSELNDLAGFVIYYGEDQNNLDELITIEDPAQLSHIFDNLDSGKTYYFGVTAYNSSGVESEMSEIVSKDT